MWRSEDNCYWKLTIQWEVAMIHQDLTTWFDSSVNVDETYIEGRWCLDDLIRSGQPLKVWMTSPGLDVALSRIHVWRWGNNMIIMVFYIQWTTIPGRVHILWTTTQGRARLKFYPSIVIIVYIYIEYAFKLKL